MNYLPELSIIGDSGIDLATSKQQNTNVPGQSAPGQVENLVDNLTEATLEAENDAEVADRVVAAAFKSVGFGPMLQALQNIA